MEVAGQWRREWAGAAEYGKITEGGVTRRVARALEVLNASGPGAQVRVMRAAWHSSAGPGAPASSYMMHSSRHFISSGSRLLTSPSLIKVSKPLEITSPLEISSIPLDASPDDGTDTENYKVTEPDDSEISEPSKWKSSTRSHRMPSEESSSTDNASIIDLDSRNNSLRRNWRRHSYDSENSDVPKSRSRTQSPLLENPITLSTLKYKSLLNNSNDNWHNRRKSYSFEDTKPSEETIIHSNDKLVMESSTDSGICKSTEIVNDTIDERDEHNYNETHDINAFQEETFKDWLVRTRSNKVPKVVNIKVNKDYGSKSPIDRVGLQSTKVSISLANEPTKLVHKIKDDDDLKRTKRVEFCKTELHFAAESGTVNIISTDEKPPPSNDFRKRRSAFVPIQPNYDKSITLFGDKFDDLLVINGNKKPSDTNEANEIESDENTAATKSILKNKIPKPKPYLLGENMDFGENKVTSANSWGSTKIKPSAVFMKNKQLNAEPIYVKKAAYECREKSNTPKEDKTTIKEYKTSSDDVVVNGASDTTFKQSLRTLQSSPILQTKSRTRQLKKSDLTYFGVGNKNKPTDNSHFTPIYKHSVTKTVDDMFNAVRLVQQASHNTSRNKSDVESEYQNIPIKLDYTPMPVPRSTIKTDKFHDETSEQTEKEFTEKIVRSSRLRRDEATKYDKSRSISEPPKHRMTNPIVQSSIREIGSKINKINNEIIAQQNKNAPTNLNAPVTRTGENFRSGMKNLKAEGDLSENKKYEENTSTAKSRFKTSPRQKQPTPMYVNMDLKPNDNTMDRKNKSEIKHAEGHERKSRSHTRKADLKPEEKVLHNSLATTEKTHQRIKNGKKPRDPHSTISSVHSNTKNSSGKSSERYNGNSIEKEAKEKCKKRMVTKETTEEKTSKPRRDDNIQYSHNGLKSNKNDSNYDKHCLAKNQGKDATADVKKRSYSYDRKGNDNSDYKRNRRHNRDEYVLNYDDKNGTFASMNKVKLRSKSPEKNKINSSRKKHDKKEANNNDKYPLLQYLHQSKQNGLYDNKRKWRSKVYAERTCQLL